MNLATSILNCLCSCEHDNAQPDHSHSHNSNQSHTYGTITEKVPLLVPSPTPAQLTTLTTQTTQILTILLHAPCPSDPNANLTPLISANSVSTASWSSYLAERVLHGLEEALKGDQANWGEAIRETYAQATELARAELSYLWEYARDHPYEVAASVLLTVMALGVLGRLVPGLVRLLGFAKVGPVEGESPFFISTLFASLL